MTSPMATHRAARNQRGCIGLIFAGAEAEGDFVFFTRNLLTTLGLIPRRLRRQNEMSEKYSKATHPVAHAAPLLIEGISGNHESR
jgi:hypothetical protein